MSAWLGQVPLRLSGQTTGLLAHPAPRKEISHPFLGQARLGSRGPDLGQENLFCCNLPSGQAQCFYHDASGNCVPIWTSPARREGAPDCIQGARGSWQHPECVRVGPTLPGGGPVPEPAPGPLFTGPEILVCPQPDGKWTVLDYKTHQLMQRDVLESQFRTITDNHITYLPEEWVCKDPNSPCAPYCGETGAPAPTETAPEPVALPETGGPVPASGVPVLPPPMTETFEMPPTGAWPGQPFAQRAPPRQVPLRQPPSPVAPPPAACPLGPVPLRRWAESCIASKL